MAGLLFVLADRLYVREHAELSIQSQLNLRFAARPLESALTRYPRLHPPFYPLILWAAARSAVPLERVNELLLFALLIGACVFFRRQLPDIHYLVPLIGFTVAHPLYVNLHQITAEAVFAPLLLALVAVFARYLRTGTGRTLVATAIVLSLLCLSRYFAVLFAFPLVLANLLALSPVPRARRLLHATWVPIVAGVPIGGWMVMTRLQTGYWTGTDRSAPRSLPESVQHWSQLTTFGANLRLTAKTLFLDFFSPWAYAAHSVVTRPYELSAVEWATLALLVACAAVVIALWRSPAQWAPVSPFVLAAQFLGVYLAMTIVLWTVGNNDPIYTRFLFPAYPLVGVVVFRAYAGLKARARSGWPLLPFRLLFAQYLVVQLVRGWRAEALPVRYFY